MTTHFKRNIYFKEQEALREEGINIPIGYGDPQIANLEFSNSALEKKHARLVIKMFPSVSNEGIPVPNFRAHVEDLTEGNGIVDLYSKKDPSFNNIVELKNGESFAISGKDNTMNDQEATLFISVTVSFIHGDIFLCEVRPSLPWSTNHRKELEISNTSKFKRRDWNPIKFCIPS